MRLFILIDMGTFLCTQPHGSRTMVSVTTLLEKLTRLYHLLNLVVESSDKWVLDNAILHAPSPEVMVCFLFGSMGRRMMEGL